MSVRIDLGDSGTSLPDGGTTGQALIKQSAADGDADWDDTASLSDDTPLAAGTAASGTSVTASRSDHQHPAPGGATGLSGFLWLPGVDTVAFTTDVLVADQIYYQPVIVSDSAAVDRLSCEVTVAAAAGKLLRMALYSANASFQPTDLVVDGGTVAADSTGLKSAVISEVLVPGRYLLALQSNGTPTLRVLRGGSSITGVHPSFGTTPWLIRLVKSSTFAAFADPGVAWDTPNYSGTAPFLYSTFLRRAAA